MPPSLKQFLQFLPDDEAAKIFEYFDGTPYHELVSEMNGIIVKSHETLFPPIIPTKKKIES